MSYSPDLSEFDCGLNPYLDLSTRKGYKKVYEEFDVIYRRMDLLYISASSDFTEGNEKILGGLVGIWTKFCTDAVLRNRLVRAGAYTLPFLFINNQGCPGCLRVPDKAPPAP